MIQSLSSLERRLQALELARMATVNQHISISDERTIIYAGQNKKIYVPTGTGFIAHQCDDWVRGIMGPFGSGKSTWAIEEIVRRSCRMPRWFNGRRRSRWGIVRNTSGELETTTLQTWLAWHESLGDIYKRQKPLLTYEHTFNDGHGIVELELLFIALDRPQDVRKIKSLELTGVYFNELSEIPKAAFDHMKGRINRYPSKAFCKEPYFSGMIFDTNPPDEDHWIPKMFEDNQFKGHRLFKQPPGLLLDQDGNWIRNPDADNATNLTDDYYLKLAEGQTKEFIKVFCLGQYGSVGNGKLVYPEFNADLHAVDNLKPIEGDPLIICWDFGLTPACVVIQPSPRGQLLVLKEYVGDGIGIRSFAESIVIPGIARDFPNNKIGLSVADPAGAARNEIVEEMSCIGELDQLGIHTIKARTNDIEPRLGAVRYFLNKMMDGKPCFVMDKKKCPTLYKGFTKNYIFNRIAVAGEERYKDQPSKNMASHPMDALGYGCIELASDYIIKGKMSNKVVDMWNPIARIF